MQSKKPKKQYDSEQRIECGHCGAKMVRRQLKKHTRTFCTVLHARHFDFRQYSSENFREDLKIVRDQFGLDYPMVNLIKDHKEFVRILSLPNNRQRFAKYWFKSDKMKVWDMLGSLNHFNENPSVSINICNDSLFFWQRWVLWNYRKPVQRGL